MGRSAGATRATTLRRGAILEAVAFAAERLLLASDWRDAADEVLARLGIAADVSRAYVIANETDELGRACCRQLFEWCAPGIASQFNNPALRGKPWSDIGFTRWVAIMTAGDPIATPVRALPEGEREELERQDIRSIAALPVSV